MDVSGYTISKILSQLTSDDLCRWYLMIFFSRKIISWSETWYETHDVELLAIVEKFKI